MEFLNTIIIKPFVAWYHTVVSYIPNIMTMLFVIVIGFILAWLLKRMTRFLFKLIKFNELGEKAGLSVIFNDNSLSVIGERFVYWFIVFVFLMLGLSALKLTPIDHLITSFFLYLPKLIAAIIIFIAGYLLGDFLDRIMVLAAVGSHLPHAKAIGRLTKLAIVIFFIFISLDLLEIGKNVIVAAFSIIFGGAVLGLAIAFGFGAKDLVKEWLEKMVKDSRNDKDDGISHL
ncbi:MAG: hypothetical protein M1381_12210 [Deltaproteobacteria bacterium]|nr:hypothetical protein [Deltaproteobacteria bacterium]MCL5792424.1 hypothetical protein [Deltaproteobacteria bacterium]